MWVELKVNEANILKLKQASEKALYDTAVYYSELVKKKIKDSGWSDTWELINSIFIRDLWYKVQVWSKTAQAVIMEFGRKPMSKRPPMQSLVPWANRKGIVSGSTLGALSSKDKWIIYIMAKSIGEKGIKPRKYFSETFEENLENLNKYYIQRFTLYTK